MQVNIRDVVVSDLPVILDLNQRALPHVSNTSMTTLEWFLAKSVYFRVALLENNIVGFLIGLTPEVDYSSLNFLWFRQRYPNFVYIDRVVIAESSRHCGIGRRLYQDVEDSVSSMTSLLTAEVNIRPRNDASISFHKQAGFEEVGTQETEGGTKTVSLLAKTLFHHQSG